ncbi:hypothetical protein ACFCXR_30000, partial [Streptomyces noursei]
ALFEEDLVAGEGERPVRAGGRAVPPPGGARLDLSGARGARLRAALAAVQEICPEFSAVQVLRERGGAPLHAWPAPAAAYGSNL